MQTPSNKKPLTAYHLKLIALVTMVIDHVAALLVSVRSPVYPLLRGIGRVAFPLYAFLIAEGCRHTRSREKYLLRLGGFALISQLPFILAFFPHDWAEWSDTPWILFLNSTNVFYTMFFAVACIHIWETLRRSSRPLQLAAAGFFGVCLAFWAWLLLCVTGSALPFVLMIFLYLACFLTACHVLQGRGAREPDWLGNVLCALPLLPIFFLATVLNCDYDVFGVVLICLIYAVQDRRLQIGALALGILYEYGWEGWLMRVVLWNYSFQWGDGLNLCFALLAVGLACCYNGRRGRNSKWAFYAAYPGHIAVLAALRAILGL